MRSCSRSDCSQSRRLQSHSSGHREARCDRSLSHRSRYCSRGCCRSRDCSPLSSDHSRLRKRSWRPRWSRRDHKEAVVASRDRCKSGSTVEPNPAVAGGSIPLPTSSFPDLVKLFLSLSRPVAQRDAAAGVLPGPHLSGDICSPWGAASVPAPGVATPAGAAPATTSTSQHELARESSRPERRHRRSSGRERSCSGEKGGRGRSPSPARSAHSVSVSASSSSESSDTEERVSAMPSPPRRTTWRRWWSF